MSTNRSLKLEANKGAEHLALTITSGQFEKLLGGTDVRATMIYAHILRRGGKVSMAKRMDWPNGLVLRSYNGTKAVSKRRRRNPMGGVD